MKPKLIFSFCIVIIVFSSINPCFSKTEDSYLSPFAIHDPDIPHADNVKDVSAIGAKWVRYAGGNGIVWDMIEPQQRNFEWSFHDRLYLETYQQGINMFVSTIAANKAYNVEHGHTPPNMEAYLNFLTKAVERYDGDGIDDAPGSPVIDIWQIENELDMFWKDSPRNYAKLLKESYKAIKKANPRAKVAIAGVGSPHGFYGRNKFYILVLKELASIKDNPQDRYFDIFDFHWYPFTGEYNYLIEHIPGNPTKVYFKQYLDIIKQTLNEYGYVNMPIFITETGQYSDRPSLSKILPTHFAKKLTEFHSEKKQALFLLKLYIYSIANGVKKIFWVTLTEWHNFGADIDGVFDHVGLINNLKNSDGFSHKKLAYYTYKKMVEILEDSDWDNIQKVQEKNGISIYKFTKRGKPIWAAWNDNPSSKQISINMHADEVRITYAIPNYVSGKYVTNYAAAFKTEIRKVRDNKLIILLEDFPIFIEAR